MNGVAGILVFLLLPGSTTIQRGRVWTGKGKKQVGPQ